VSDFVRAAIEQATEAIEIREWEAMLRHLQDTAPELPPWEELKEEIAHAHCPGAEFCDNPDMHEPLVR
jgi:hypothetical protein